MKKTLLKIISVLFISTQIFSSCSNIFNSAFSDSNNSEKAVDGGYQISGTVSPYDFAETSPARTAFPTAPDSTTTLYYTVTATLGSNSIPQDVEGKNGAQFNLKIPSTGEWSVSATCFGTDSTRTSVVYKTDKPAIIKVSNDSPSKFANLTLKPLMTAGKSGTLNLEIDGTGLDSKYSNYTCSVECISGNILDFNDHITVSYTTGSCAIKSKVDNPLPSGSYTLNLNFFSANGVCFYSTTEAVNIYDGLETNRWVKNGNEEYITSDGKFVLTDAIVNKFQQESIYVDSSALSDDASGSWIDPYQTLDAAIARLGTGSSVKTIFVAGNHETNKVLNFSNNGNVNHDLTIKKNPRATAKPVIKTTTTSSFIVGGPYKIVIENIDFTGCGNDVEASPTGTNSDPNTKAGAFLYFPSSTGSAEITNCKISDYYSDKGGAICAGAYSTTTLTNVNITRCKATKGGAISLYGSLTFYGGSITDCNNGSIYAETASPFLKIIDVTIENCNNSTDSTPLIDAYAATNEFTKVTIKDCHNNGGILSSGTNVILTGCSITDCSTNGNYSMLISLGGNITLIDTAINGEGDGKKIISTAGNTTAYVAGSTSLTNGNIFFNQQSKVCIIGELTAEKCATLIKSSPDYRSFPQVLECNIEGKTAAENAEILKASVPKFSYDGTFEISETGLILPVAFVDGTNGKTKAAGGNGSKDNPFNQVNEAVTELIITARESNGLIYVAGTTLENASIEPIYSQYSYLTNLVIKQWSGKTDAVIKRGTVNDSIIKVGLQSTLTLEDIDIDGNNVVLTDKNGAGIYIDGEGSATVNNVKIYGCKNYGQGGAIFVKTTTNTSGSSSLVLKGNTVIGSDVTGTLSEENCSNMAHDGGAIYYYNIYSTSLKIEESVIIKGNYASANGGAIYLNYRYAYLNGTITNNKAGNAGGAIYSYKGFVKDTGTISGNTSSMGSIYSVVSSNTNEYIYLNSKTKIGPDDEIVLGYDGNNSSNFGRIYFDEELSSQTNPIKVSCENPVATARYVSGKTIGLIESEILKLSYNGIFRFITSGDNRGKLETAPVYVSGTTGNNSNPGTEAEPLATVAAAVNKISGYGGTIYVAGTTSETDLIGFPASVTSEFKIMHWAGKQKAVIKRATAQTSCMIIIRKDNNVTFKDVDIDGSDVSITYTYGPAGIYCSGNSTASLTLENVNVKNMLRSVSDYPLGGAIHSSQTTFTMKGGSITNCRIERLSDGVTSGKGGAIYAYAGTTTLENVTISGNKAEEGNAIHVNSGELELKGSTNFSTAPNDINDIYLYSNASAKIKVIGDLSADKVAVISLPMGDNGLTTRTEKTILISSEANGVKNNYQKFSINSTNYSLVEDGTIIRSVNDFSELTGISKALVQLEDDTTLTYSDFESIRTKDIQVKTNGNQLTIQASDTLLTGKLKIDAGDADGNKGIVKFLSGGEATLSGPAINASGSNAEFEITNADVQISVSQGTEYDGAFKISDGAAVTFENVDFTDLRFSAPTVQYGLFNIDSGNLTYKGGSITNVSGGGYGGTALLVYGSGSAKIELSNLSISDISKPSQRTLISAEGDSELIMDAVEITGFTTQYDSIERSIIQCDSGNTNNKLSLINIHDNDFESSTSNRDPIAPGIAIKIGTGGYLSIEDSYIQNNYGFYQGCISVAGELIFNNSFVLNNTTSCTIDQFQERSVNGNAFYVDSSGSLKLKGSSNICDNKMSIEGERVRSPKVHGPAIYINGGEVTKEESVIMTGNKNTNEGMPDNCQVYCVSGTYNGTSYSDTGVPGTEW